MNQVNLMGRLTAEPEYRTTPNGIAVTTFSLAVPRRRTKEKEVTDFFNIVAWRTHAEFAAKYLHKGQRVVVLGELQTRSYTDKNGIKRNVVEVSANDIEFADSKQDVYQQPANSQQQYQTAPPEPPTGYTDGYPMPNDGDLPF